MPSDTMEAILVDKFVKTFAELTPREVPRPQPKAGEVEVPISHAALTHVDMLYALGKHQNNRRHMVDTSSATNSPAPSPPPPPPLFPPGTRVFGSSLGSYAESICVPTTSIRRVPSHWTPAEACAVGAWGAISYGALIDAGKLAKGQAVLVLGATGGLGVMAVQIAQAVGASVVVAVGGGEASEKGRMMKTLLRADYVVDCEDCGWEGRVRGWTRDREGVDLVVDAVGAVENGIACLRYRGRLVIVGFAARGGRMEERFGEDGRRCPHRTTAAWEGFMSLVDAGKIRPVIFRDRTYRGLGELPVALDDLHSRRVWGRAVLEVPSPPEREEKKEVVNKRLVGQGLSRL
ncbi:NAD(P)-binding protein [Westerdykella ornata]|uniref:NAD(P)-binding protein n=1 Tax=Westerdykella ornata TaxID=318751 RepID=A0A6A6JBZ1_WESOR|nr:NAD(P)-binding protein [Westerdykella ornata]KAF2273734.1 NAD(P)-binding protein [Westerdykella ornata]